MTDLETLVVGIDAGCLPVLNRLSEEGRLPTIDSLRDGGFVAPLESQIPPWTPSAWPSVYTGVNPGKHGVFGFVAYEGYDWRVVSADDVNEFTLWELLDRAGLTSVVVNGPVTYPPPEIDGAVLPGFIGPENPPCHPEGLLDDVREAIGEYRVYPAYHTDDREHSRAEKRAEYRRLVAMRGDAFEFLADRHDPDFGFLQFQRTDTVFHEFDGDWEMVAPVYEEMDAALASVLDACDPDRVFVVSDHGMGRYAKQTFHVNDYLRDEGFVSATRGGKGMPGWSPIRDRLREGETAETWSPSFSERLVAGAASVGLTAGRVRAVLERVNLADVVGRYAPANATRAGSEQVDFAESRAYLRARTELGVRINLEGREPAGVVPPEEYDSVREDLLDSLRAATAPDGEPVFERVEPRESFFEGPAVEDAADVIVVPNQFEHFLSDQLRGEQFGERKAWDHKRDGVFLAAGDGIDADANVAPHLFDVAPTVLASLGEEPSDRMDGSVLPVVADPGRRAYPEYETTESTASADVEDRLADLGYM